MIKTVFYKKLSSLLFFLLIGLFAGDALFSQTAGQITSPASTAEGRSILDPNGDGNVFHPSPNTFEINYQPLPQLQNEPSGDPSTGATNGHTDLLAGPNGDESPTYIYWDSVNQRFLFRVRIGKASAASKGYAFLFNLDPKTTKFGPDSNLFSGSNPGFQLEISLLSGFGVRIFNHVNGIQYTVPGGPEPYWHKAVAENGEKVFYDFYVDLDEIQKGYPGFNASTQFRVVATTVTSAQSGVSGTISDLSGIVDDDFNSPISALIALIKGTPIVTAGTVSNLANMKPPAPAVFGPIMPGGSVTVNGSSFDTDVTIRLYVNGVQRATTSTFTGNDWSISGLNLSQDDKVYAIATRNGIDSDQSSTIYVGAVTQCTQAPTNFVRSGNSVTGFLTNIQGVNHVSDANTNLIIRIYGTSGNRLFSTKTDDGATKVALEWEASTYQFTLSGSGNPFNTLNASNFYVTAQLTGQCESSGGVESGVKTNPPVITTSPISVGASSISGTAVAGSTVFLYQNGVRIGDFVVATGGNWTVNVSAVSLIEGRQITARAQSTDQILSDASNIVQVGATIQTTTKPYIVGQYSQKANVTIEGYSFEPNGTIIRILVDDVLVGQTTVDIFGNWKLEGVNLTGKTTIKARAQAEGKLISPFSDTVNIQSGVIENTNPPVIFSNANEIAIGSASPVTGTGGLGTVRIYANGTQVATGSGSSFSISPGTLNPGDEIYATNQETGKFESIPSNTVLVVVAANDTKYLAIKSLEPNSVDGGGAKTATFTYTVRDNNFALESGVTIQFDVVNGNGSLSTASAVSNGSGEVSVTYTTVAADNESTVNVRARVINSGVTVTSAIGSLVVKAAPAGPHTLTLTGPDNVVVGQTSGNFTITLRDSEGSAINATESIVFNLSTSQESGSATFSPTQITINAGSSSGTFTYSNSNMGTGTHQITASRSSGGSLTGGTSASHSITVTITATRLVVTGSSTQTAGSSQSLTITARDGAGSVATTYTGDKTLTFFGAGDAPNGTKPTIRDKNGSTVNFGASTTITFTNGVANVVTESADPPTINNGSMTLYLAQTANIGVNDGTINTAEADRLEVTVSSAAANTIAIDGGNGQTATAGSTIPTAPTVRVTDTYGNTVAGTEVTFAIASGGGSLNGTDANPATSSSNGIATAPGWTLGTSVGTNEMTASVAGLTGSPLTFTVTGNAGEATKIVFLQQPTTAVSTVNLDPVVTVEFQDSNNNRVLSTDNVTIGIGSNPNSGTLSGTLTRPAVSGVATFSGLSIDKIGTGYTLAASSGSFNVTSNTFNITAGAASLNNTTATVPAGVAGSTTSITITVRDAGGNPLTGQAGLLAVSISEGSPNNGATLSSITDNGNGTYTITYTPTKTGDDIIAISLNGTALGSSPYTSTVSAGAVTNFLVERSDNPFGNITEQTAGNSFSIRITARDAQNNTVTGFTNTVNVALNKNSLQSGGGTTANFVAGVLASHSVQINTAATAYQITATQTGEASPTGNSNSFNVVPASGNKIIISTQPAGGASGSALATQPIVEVQDALNNRVTAFTGEITVSIHSGTDGTLTGTTVVNAVAGVVTYTDLVLAGLISQNYILRFSGSGLESVNSNAVTVTPGVASRLAITGSSTQVAGTAQNLTITAYDSKGNVATGYTGDKNLTFSGANASLNSTNPTVTNKDGLATNFGTAVTVTFTNGVATVSGGNNGVMRLYRVETATIAAQDQNEIAAAGADRLTVTVTHGSLESFVVSFSSPQSSGTSFTETNTITARDSWGNTVTNFNASATPVTITTSLSGTVSGLGSGTNNILNRESDFTNGVANVTGNLIYSGATGTGTFTAIADGKSGTSSNVIISAGTPSQIAVNAGNNQSATIGTAVATNPSVIVRDAANNPVQGISVTFSITGGGGSVTDAIATTNSNGIATVGSWTLGSSVGTNALSATITGSNPAISTSFTSEGLPVPDLSVNNVVTNNTTPNISGLSNQPEGTVVTVTLKNAAGNDVVDGSGSAVSYTGTVGANGSWSITVTNALAEGVYEATAAVVDGSGATRTATGSLTIDTTPPALTVNNSNTNDTTPTITGTSNQPEGSEVTVRLLDNAGNPVLGADGNALSYTATVTGNGTWSVNITNELGFAVYTVEATTTDTAGNTTTSTGSLTIEEDEPEIIISVTNVTVPGGRIGELTTTTVTLQDQNGNPITGSADLLGFGLSGSNAGVEISGITDNGDGTYSISYTPTASGEDLITITLGGEAVDGSPFTSIVSDEAWQLVFTQSPNSSTEVGDPFGTVIVEVRDSGGNRVEGYSGAISIEITEGTGGPLATDTELIGTTSVDAVNSIATFEGIFMVRSGINYTLTATADEMDSGISNPFDISPGPPWQLEIRERDARAALIDQFLSTFNLMAAAKTQNSESANNETQLEGNRIPMYMVILDEFNNVTFVEEGDTRVEITTNSASGRFFLQQASNNPINLLTILRNQQITFFYYEDPNVGELIIRGRPTPPPGAREIREGETPIVIRKPGRIRATPNEIYSEINVREEILISLQDDTGQKVFAPDPGVTITLSSSSHGGQFYSEKSGGAPIVSASIRPAESSVVVYYQDSFVGAHTLTMNGLGVPNPTDTVQFTIEQAGILSTLSIAGPDTLHAGEQGGAYRLILQDEFQNEIVYDKDLTFDLNLKKGVNTSFYLVEESSNKLIAITNNRITIPAGESSVPFYLRQTRSGDKILQAQFSDDDLELSAGKPIHFTPDFEQIILAMVAGNGQQELVMHQLSEDLTVTIIDQYENPITNREVVFRLIDTPLGASDMELMLSTDKKQANKSVASKFAGNMDIAVKTDTTGMAVASFVLGDRSGDYIIKATSPGLEPVEFIVTAVSLDYILHQNYSNPFNNVTRIVYEVPELSEVRIEVYDIIGRRIAVLVNETRDMGIYNLDFDASRYGLSSGVYLYRMIAISTGSDNSFSRVRRMVYVK